MADQWFNGAVEAGIATSAKRDRLDDALYNLQNQMNGWSDKYTYDDYGYSEHGWDATIDSTLYNDEMAYLEAYAEEIRDAHIDGDIVAADGDVWAIIDQRDDWGYGRADTSGVDVDLDQDGTKETTIYPVRALSMEQSGTSDPNKVTTGFVMHEEAHCFGAEHRDGDHYLETFNGTDYIYDISPMGYAYTYDKNESVDTCFAGGGTIPDYFCVNDNYANVLCGDCDESCLHVRDLENCTKDAIESGTPL